MSDWARFPIRSCNLRDKHASLSGATLSGGASSHTWFSGAQALPSMSIEVQLPDVPFFGMNYGARINSFQVQAQRSGLLTASLNIMAQGETIAATTQSGTLSEFVLERFGQSQGEVRRNNVALGNVISAELTYSNNLEAVEVIRSDGRIADADPGIVALTGNITTRFEDRVLLDQATSRLPCELQFRWAAGAAASLVWTAPRPACSRTMLPLTEHCALSSEGSYSDEISTCHQRGRPPLNEWPVGASSLPFGLSKAPSTRATTGLSSIAPSVLPQRGQKARLE